MFFEFKEIGDIEEIVILGKKDWRGKKYGFVRFGEVVDERVAETKLNNIWLNGRKISANISKYKRRVIEKLPLNHGDSNRGVPGVAKKMYGHFPRVEQNLNLHK